MMSVSMLIMSPTFLFIRLVSLIVVGIIETSKYFSPTLETVRLIPSRAIDPLGAMYLKLSESNFIL